MRRHSHQRSQTLIPPSAIALGTFVVSAWQPDKIQTTDVHIPGYSTTPARNDTVDSTVSPTSADSPNDQGKG